MSTVSFKRSANVNEIPIVDGQLVFDETHNKIYMDNGTDRLQYGGDVSLIEDASYATSNNTFSANGSLNLFTQKLSVIDNKDSALAATEQHVPVGCLALQSIIGNANYSGVGNTISDSLVTLKNGITSINGQLTANNTTAGVSNVPFRFGITNDGKYGYILNEGGADTVYPFSSVDHIRLNLYGYAYGWAEEYGGNAKARTTGRGTYTLSGTEVDHITGVSGSMTVAYTNPQGQSITASLSAGQTIQIENSNSITFTWNASNEARGYDGGNASCEVSASVAVDVYF